ncbi:MAG: hypothetical protein HGGPFJEG_00803 [Ignavibacteria bacterium]|nr:hypothetical protein [Ignavibacteria bacterium]
MAFVGAFTGRLALDSSDAFIGGAVIFWYMIAGFTIGIIAGFFLIRFFKEKNLKTVIIILGIFAVAFVSFVVTRLSF